MSHNICRDPFHCISLRKNGDIYTCPPDYIKWKIGNIFENSIEEIWNGPAAQKIRRAVLAGKYKTCCNTHLCAPNYVIRKHLNSKEFQTVMPLPTYVTFHHDEECNHRCIICRHDFYQNSPERLLLMNAKIEKYYLPLLKGAKVVALYGEGDPLASTHGRLLIKRIAQTYPDIFFTLYSNGSLMNEALLTELGIINRLNEIKLSIHAATRETHEQIVRTQTFEAILDNLAFLSKLYEQGKVKTIILIFVVQVLNYQEIPAFAQLAKKFHAQVQFLPYLDHTGDRGLTYSPESYQDMAVFLPQHPDYHDLGQILQDPILKENHVILNPAIASAQSDYVRYKSKSSHHQK